MFEEFSRPYGAGGDWLGRIPGFHPGLFSDVPTGRQSQKLKGAGEFARSCAIIRPCFKPIAIAKATPKHLKANKPALEHSLTVSTQDSEGSEAPARTQSHFLPGASRSARQRRGTLARVCFP
jgi:hypothetical protein